MSALKRWDWLRGLACSVWVLAVLPIVALSPWQTKDEIVYYCVGLIIGAVAWGCVIAWKGRRR